MFGLKVPSINKINISFRFKRYNYICKKTFYIFKCLYIQNDVQTY